MYSAALSTALDRFFDSCCCVQVGCLSRESQRLPEAYYDVAAAKEREPRRGPDALNVQGQRDQGHPALNCQKFGAAQKGLYGTSD